jgi:hypothetical protein
MDTEYRSYTDMICRDAYCSGCGQRKWLYAWTEEDLDRSGEEFSRGHVLCSGDEVDILTGQPV